MTIYKDRMELEILEIRDYGILKYCPKCGIIYFNKNNCIYCYTIKDMDINQIRRDTGEGKRFIQKQTKNK